MNLIVIPFHDWRKIIKEGFRTRDSHFIESLEKSKSINTLLVVNRPTTILEIFLKKKGKKIEGEIVLKRKNFSLIKVSNKTYVIDFISNDILGQIRTKFLWFIKKYANKDFVHFINESLSLLEINKYNVVSQNVFAHKLIPNLEPQKSVFDAWDNFCLINDYYAISDKIKSAYLNYAEKASLWITNSNDNISYFSKEFSLSRIELIKNGLDTKRFNSENNYLEPNDIKNIKKPIVGFGGKITQTINIEWLNYEIEKNPDFSFVLIGQILDKAIFNSILKRPNVYYLGDKFYDEYPNYVNSFDICLVPYYIEEDKKSGTNPIKVYEYLALNKKVIGTNGNGLEDLKDYLFLADNKEDMAEEIMKGFLNTKSQLNLKDNSWDTKTEELLNLF